MTEDVPDDKVQKYKYLFNIEDYKVVKELNRGGFALINLVKNKKNGSQYVAKTNLIQNKTQNKRFISREIRILIQIQHPTIIQFQGFSFVDFHSEKNITILMDYMNERSLATLLLKASNGRCDKIFENTQRQIILVGIARGMMILHELHVIHRDLKPENILLDSEYRPRISDFGLSKFFDPHHSSHQSMADSGTAAYMAPEVIQSDHFNTKADVFAFEILMYEVITGKCAYQDEHLSPFQLKNNVLEGLRPKIDDGFPIKKGLKTLMEKCWSNNPKERSTFQEIFKKLSLSREDYFLHFESNIPEPMIIDDDDDDEEEDKEDYDDDFEKEVCLKYCLEGVDINDLFDYVEEIKEEPAPFGKQEKNNNDKEESKNEIQPKKTAGKNFNSNKLFQQCMLHILLLVCSVEIYFLKIELLAQKDKDTEISSLKTEIDKLERDKSSEISSLKEEINKLEKDKSSEISSLEALLNNKIN